MKEQDIVDFEAEIRKTCEKYESKMAHAALVGVLTVVRHLYLDARLDNFEDEERVETVPPTNENPTPK